MAATPEQVTVIPEPDIERVNKEHIVALMEAQVEEGRTLDYKLALPPDSSGLDKFLASVTAFANTAGGDLVYGVDAPDSIPVAIPGLADFRDEKDQQRLENVLQARVAPRIPGVRFKTVQGFERPVLVVRTPKSWNGPHMIRQGDWSRFCFRSNKSNVTMDYTQIRSAFEGAAGLPERIRNWCKARIASVFTDETPVPLQQSPRTVLHCVPLTSFENELRFTASDLQTIAHKFWPLGCPGGNHRVNLDGVVHYFGLEQKPPYYAYAQAFRSGRMESVRAEFERGPKLQVSVREIERDVIQAVSFYLEAVHALQIRFPIVVSVGLAGARGAYLAGGEGWRSRIPVDRDILVFPAVMIKSRESPLESVLRSLFDSIWNAFGTPSSPSYDDQGAWNP